MKNEAIILPKHKESYSKVRIKTSAVIKFTKETFQVLQKLVVT